jgi:hypothetical protein
MQIIAHDAASLLSSDIFPALLIEANLASATALFDLSTKQKTKVRVEKEIAYDLSKSSNIFTFLKPRHAHPITISQHFAEAIETARHFDFP